MPCTRPLTEAEVSGNYEEEIGQSIAEAFQDRDPVQVPGVLVANHGPFTWGEDAWEAVHNSVVLEEVARMAWHMLQLAPDTPPIPDYLLNCHFFRKHGPDAYFDINDMKG